MKNRIHIIPSLLAILLIPVLLHAQSGRHATVQFSITNNHDRTVILTAGLHEDGTNGLDNSIGEVELPPMPPVEIFDVRFIAPSGAINLGEGTLTDLRPWRTIATTFTEAYSISYQAGRTYSGVSLRLPAAFPPQVKKMTIDGKQVKAGDSVVTQFASGTISVGIDYNLAPVTFNANPASIAFALGNHDTTLPVQKRIIITPSISGTAWQVQTNDPWLTLSKNSGTGVDSLFVSINTFAFTEGTDTGRIHITSNADNDPTDVIVTISMLLGNDNPLISAGYSLDAPYPNPLFSGIVKATKVGFTLPTPASVSLAVFDVLGKNIRTLVGNEPLAPGHYLKTWDGHDACGVRVVPGLYFYHLNAGAAHLIKEIVIR